MIAAVVAIMATIAGAVASAFGSAVGLEGEPLSVYTLASAGLAGAITLAAMLSERRQAGRGQQ